MTLLNVLLWNAPGLRDGLAAHGIACDPRAPHVALVGVESDADLDAIRRTARDLPILARIPRLATPEHATRAVQAVELGAEGLVPADAPIDELAAALFAVSGGGTVAHPFAGELLIRGMRARSAGRHQFPITQRERDVLGLLVEGLTTAEIAARLGIGFHTAQTHLKNLYRKLEVGSKAAATAIALRHQLV